MRDVTAEIRGNNISTAHNQLRISGFETETYYFLHDFQTVYGIVRWVSTDVRFRAPTTTFGNQNGH